VEKLPARAVMTAIAVGDELGAVVTADQRWRGAAVFEDPLEHVDCVVGADPSSCAGGEGFAGVLVGDGEDFDRPAISGLVDEEVERPNVVRAGRGHMARHPLAPLPAMRPRRQTQAFIAPQPLHAFAVAGEAIPTQQRVDAPVAVAGMTPGQQP
jgi:hypothetical protein